MFYGLIPRHILTPSKAEAEMKSVPLYSGTLTCHFSNNVIGMDGITSNGKQYKCMNVAMLSDLV